MFWSIPVHSAPIDKPNEQVEHIRLRAGELPAVKLTADILYRILTSEVAAARGYYDVAGQTLLSLARDTSDPRLAKRAFQLSIADRNMPQALSAARKWAVLAPLDPEAVASSQALAAANRQKAGPASAVWGTME